MKTSPKVDRYGFSPFGDINHAQSRLVTWVALRVEGESYHEGFVVEERIKSWSAYIDRLQAKK